MMKYPVANISSQAVPYDASGPSPSCKAGRAYLQTAVFLLANAADGAIWNPASLPESNITINYGSFTLQNDANVTVWQVTAKTPISSVDHHELHAIVTDAALEKFTLLDANDGGLGISFNGGATWEQLDNGYITTQFYGVAKKPGANEYIAGCRIMVPGSHHAVRSHQPVFL